MNETVQKQADRIATAEDDRGTAEELFEWVRDTFCWDMTKIRGSKHLLQEQPQRAMSFDKSCLLVSLLRSQNIPARFKFIKCTFYNEFRDRNDESIHAPVEVYLDGEWVLADPAFGEHTRQFKSVASFGEQTWEELKTSKTVAALPHTFVWPYNYLLRFVHPTIRKIRSELRKCQKLSS